MSIVLEILIVHVDSISKRQSFVVVGMVVVRAMGIVMEPHNIATPVNHSIMHDNPLALMVSPSRLHSSQMSQTHKQYKHIATMYP